LRIAAAFMAKLFPGNTEVYLPTPSWSNHTLIYKHSGLNVRQMTCGFDIQGAVQDIPNIPEKSVILFHACAHNSTGEDPKTEQWIEISIVFQQKKLFPFFDIAY
jgi:aspartate aminotransferase